MNVLMNTLAMKRRTWHMVLVIICIALCTGCKDNEESVKKVYEDYRKALMAADIDELKNYLGEKQQAEMLGQGAEMKLKMALAFMPDKIIIKKITLSDDKATIELTGRKANQPMKGTVEMIKEDGWRILKENWSMDMNAGFFGEVEAFMEDPSSPPQVQQVLEGHQGQVDHLAFTPDNRYLVSCSYDDYSLRLWDPVSGQELSMAKTPSRVRGIAIMPDSSGILTADVKNHIMLWRINNDTIMQQEIIGMGMGDSLAVSPDGKHIAATAWQKPVKLMDVEKKKIIDEISSRTEMRILKFSPSGDLLAGGGDGNNYWLWGTEDWDEDRYQVKKVDARSGISSIDFTQDEKYMATGHLDSSIVIYDTETHEELHNYYVRDAATWAVRFSPDNALLATAQNNNKIYLWDIKTAKQRAVLEYHTGPAVSLAFSPDGRILASGSGDRKILLWGTGAPQTPPPAPKPTKSAADIAADAAWTPQKAKKGGLQNLLRDPNAERVTPVWKTEGEAEVELESDGNPAFVLRYGGSFHQDVALKTNTGGRYALLIAWASSERVEEDDQTGLPYLYGYMLNRSDPNKINGYLNLETQKLAETPADEWGLIWGIYKLPPDTGGIRFYMQQADGGSAQTGSAAFFDEPGIFIFNSEAEAQAFIDQY